MSNMGYLSTPEQVTPRQNIQCSQISNSSGNLCLSWLSASLNKLKWLSRDNLSSQLFALVTYRHMKNWFTHLLDRSQITSCLDSKLFLILMYQKFKFMMFTLANNHFIVWPSSVTLIFNLPKQMFQPRVVRRQQSAPYGSLPLMITK